MNEYLSFVKGQEQVRGPREDAPRAIDEVIPSRNTVWISFQHGGSLHQFSARVLHSVESIRRLILIPAKKKKKKPKTSHADDTKPFRSQMDFTH